MKSPLPGDIFKTGQVLNNTYEIEGVLGRGGTGEVYRARNQISNRVVALKALNAQFSGNEDYLQLMRREEEMRNIIHDSVVRYSDNSRTDEGHVFLVMDYIDGPSVNDLLERGGMDARDLLIVAHRVGEGLVATHNRGITHRDLSPDNIILRNGSPEEAVIIDFGIAKDSSAGARTIVGNEFAGKYEYAAPEQMDGQAEARSDLYSLGALLLAAFRGQIPFPNATPGEIVRRKSSALDTEGVPEPLKGVIEWLSAPELADRPESAEAVVSRLDGILKPETEKPAKRRTSSGLGKVFKWVGGLVVVGGIGAGVWVSGIIEQIFPPPLPEVSPYTLSASAGGGQTGITGHAPDELTAQAIATAYRTATGRVPDEGAITLATGMPSEDWANGVRALLGAMQGLEEWSLGVNDLAVSVTGLAEDRGARDQITQSIESAAAQSGLIPAVSIVAGPRDLSRGVVDQALAGVATCGPLVQTPGEDGAYPLGATITVMGEVAGAGDADAIRGALEPVIGDRDVRVDTVTLNEELCAVRAVLPDIGPGDLSIWMGYGDTGEANLSGIYHLGDNPVVEVHMPEAVSEGSLWVSVIDNTGSVFHILPNANRLQHDVAGLGSVEQGIRQVRVIYSLAEREADARKIASEISPDEFGKSEVVAIYSDRPLFEVRRPIAESIASFVEDLQAEIAAGDVEIRAIASRLLDARP